MNNRKFMDAQGLVNELLKTTKKLLTPPVIPRVKYNTCKVSRTQTNDQLSPICPNSANIKMVEMEHMKPKMFKSLVKRKIQLKPFNV